MPYCYLTWNGEFLPREHERTVMLMQRVHMHKHAMKEVSLGDMNILNLLVRFRLNVSKLS